MGVIGNYYLDGVNLASASYVYTDAALTTPAPLGFYSQGGLYREVINASGELGPLNTCQSCISSCPLNIVNDFAGIGLYTIQLDMGVDTGAILITFTPRTTPHGILVNFSGSTYNALSSPVDGYHAAANAVRATYLGDDTDPCSAGLVAGSPYSGVIDYEWLTSSFYATGLQSNVFVSPSDASFTASAAPGDCVMVVPKVSAVTSPITITVASPAACVGTANIDVACPIKLTSFTSGKLGSLCGDPRDQTYYNAPVNGTPGVPALYDWIFEDPDGVTPLPDGDYLFEDGLNGTFHTVTNGIVTAIAAPCP